MKPNPTQLWQGQWISDEELEKHLGALSDSIAETLRRPLATEKLLAATAALSRTLAERTGVYPDLLRAVSGFSTGEIEATLQEIAEFLHPENLEKKLARELGSADPLTPTRIDFAHDVFESWAPLGFLVHIAPTNAFSVGVLSVIEGLLSGNICFLKTSASDSLFPQLFLKALVDADPSGTLAPYISVARFSSKREDLLQRLMAGADGIAVWGGESAVEGMRKWIPATARAIEWGPKISFAFVAQERIRDPEVLRKIAEDCVRLEQQACSSPQCIYVETDSHQVIDEFSREFAQTLEPISRGHPRILPGDAEAAEISMVHAIHQTESFLGKGQVIEAPDQSWRILIEYKAGLRASPLYRTVWIKPLLRGKILTHLRPLRQYLQTVGLACGPESIEELSRLLVAAGALRITPTGEMLGSYVGEPHDGVYALQRYSRRVSLRPPENLPGISSFSDLRPAEPVVTQASVLSKSEFQAIKVDARFSQLFFKSGGSSGDPKLSVFTYADYHTQMRLAAEGLYAAGLDPRHDRCMNLFFGGGLYGGFLSFFTILETLEAVQFPMAAHLDLPKVAQTIADHEVTTLLGMPSYLLQLFQNPESAQILRTYRGVQKIFYGGEHLNAPQRQFLHEDFGIAVIKSATYGSVDSGPLGFQCVHCEGSVHHLHSRLQSLEILALEADQPVEGDQVGRLVFSSKVRKGQRLERYDIGDVGRWVEGQCPCGRQASRFELLGRHGDIFRSAGIFLNYQKVAAIFSDYLNYSGELQIELLDSSDRSGPERMRIRLGSAVPRCGLSVLLKYYPDLQEVAEIEKSMAIELEAVAPEQLSRTPGSGKLKHVIDLRRGGSR